MPSPAASLTSTVRYWQGWRYLAVFVAASGLTTLFLMRRDTSATIELAPDQKVISTGPYALVRHAASLPGYREYQTQVIHRLIPGIW